MGSVMPPTALPDTTVHPSNETQIEEIVPYNVIFINDDVTTMEFVVHVLISVFKKDGATAVGLMLEVHNTGAAVVDVLPREEAELRQQQTHAMARQAGFPLRCIIEPA
jgi:ATP-dependent Clp protease adaptor protein ClpS